MEEGRTQTVTMAEEDAGARLDRVLAARLSQDAALSRSRLKALILDGQVTLAGREVRDPGHRVRAGEEARIAVPPPEAPAPRGEDIPLVIVYEDDDIIVIDKPAGLVVHPAAGHAEGTLVNALIAHCGDSLSGVGGVRRPGIVHRLDKDTTGILIAAKNDRAHRALAAQFADHGRTGPLERGYLAFVWGVPDRPRDTIDRPIDRHPTAREKMAVRSGGREAITHYEVRETFAPPPAEADAPRERHGERPGRRNESQRQAGRASATRYESQREPSPPPVASLVACRLETGRTHQIRVHMAAIGHPLMGDGTYGPGFRTKAALLSADGQAALQALERQALHACFLQIEHPVSGVAMRFESDLPADLLALRHALRGTKPSP